MRSRSNWSRASCSVCRSAWSSVTCGCATPLESRKLRSGDEIMSPGTMITRRSITLRSSRTFPGQAYRCNTLTAPRSKLFTRRPYSRANSAMKWSASSGMSSWRSRSGGTKIGITFRRKYRSSRKRPARISACRSLLVAASTRASTLIRVVPPTASMVCSCSTRSTLACVLRLMSPISSRKIVPPSATSNLPRRSATAPVNAPRTWPNSSLSMSSSGIAAQFTSTNALARRRLSAWIVLATSSLPVPFSP